MANVFEINVGDIVCGSGTFHRVEVIQAGLIPGEEAWTFRAWDMAQNRWSPKTVTRMVPVYERFDVLDSSMHYLVSA